MDNYITKINLLKETGISYGQLYRWKRMGLIPESWFIKRPAPTGQETILPRDKILDRIAEIKSLMKVYSLEELAEKYKDTKEVDDADITNPVITFDELYESDYLIAEYVNAVGNYFKKPAYTACEYMMIIACADVARKERFTTREYVDILRYSLPVADRCKSVNVKIVIFAAGGDTHIMIYESEEDAIFDSGLRVLGRFDFANMWHEIKESL